MKASLGYTKYTAKCGFMRYILTQTSLTKKEAAHFCTEDTENGFYSLKSKGPLNEIKK